MNPSTDDMDGLEEIVCLLFAPKINIKDIGELRWHLFRKNQAEAEKLPPTKAALNQHILRAHYQAMVWLFADTANPNLPPPTNYGWNEEGGDYVPKVTDLPPAPSAVIELVKCGCGKSLCPTGSCSCKKNYLACTELCACDANIDTCGNLNNKDVHGGTYESLNDEVLLDPDMALDI